MRYTLACTLVGVGMVMSAAVVPPAQKKIAEDFINQGSALGAQMSSRLKEVRADAPVALLNRAQTPTAGELAEGIRINAAVAKVYAEYEVQFRKLVNDTCDRLAGVNAKDGRDCRASNASLVKRFTLQREFLAELTGLFQFLTAKTGKYKRDSGGFHFDHDADVATFNAAGEKVYSLMQEINTLQAQGQAEIANTKNQLGMSAGR